MKSIRCNRLPREIQLERLRQVMNRELTVRERETLYAYYFLEHSLPRIAREQQVNKSTVYRTLRRAEEKLRRFLQY